VKGIGWFDFQIKQIDSENPNLIESAYNFTNNKLKFETMMRYQTLFLRITYIGDYEITSNTILLLIDIPVSNHFVGTSTSFIQFENPTSKHDRTLGIGYDSIKGYFLDYAI
jgi:hypothetical protein